ncbi:MAG TPA: hypothetical protein VF735_09055 [Pyrinomonadaceae bacterium]
MATKKGSAKKGTSKKSSKSGSSKRTLIAPKGDKRYIKRDAKGRITESDDQSKSLGQDVRQHSKHEVGPGYGDQGDQPARKSSKKSGGKKSSSKKR